MICESPMVGTITRCRTLIGSAFTWSSISVGICKFSAVSAIEKKRGRIFSGFGRSG